MAGARSGVNGRISGFETALSVSFADHVMLDGLTLENDARALVVDRSDVFDLQRSTLHGDIWLTYVSESRTVDDPIHGTLRGTYLQDLRITDNRFRGGGVGPIGGEMIGEILVAHNGIRDAEVGGVLLRSRGRHRQPHQRCHGRVSRRPSGPVARSAATPSSTATQRASTSN